MRSRQTESEERLYKQTQAEGIGHQYRPVPLLYHNAGGDKGV